MDPVKASATEAYKACLDKTASSGAKDDAFSKSCKDWLDANP